MRFIRVFVSVLYLACNILAVVYVDKLPAIDFSNSGVSSGELKQVVTELAKPTQLQSFYIEQISLGDVGSSASRFTIEHKADKFSGHAIYTKNLLGNSLEKTTEINIPEKTVQNFLQTLLDMPAYSGAYHGPVFSRITCSYPSMRIIVQTNRGLLKISSVSQQPEGMPWQVEFAGKTYHVEDNTPFVAYSLLESYLKKEIPGELSKQIQKLGMKSDFDNSKNKQTINEQPSKLNLDYTIQNLGNSNIASLVFSPDSKNLVIGSWSAKLQIWNNNSGSLVADLGGHEAKIAAVAYSKDGRYLASASSVESYDDYNKRYEDVIKLWDMQPLVNSAKSEVKPIATTYLLASPQILAFSPDNKTLASVGDDRIIRLWEIPSGKSIGTLQAEIADLLEIRSLAFSPDGKFLVSGAGDNYVGTIPATVQIWELGSHKLMTSLKGYKNAPTSITFSPDGKTLASADRTKTIRLWNIVSWQEQRSYTVEKEISSLSYSPDGKYLAAGLKNNRVNLWEVASGKLFSSTQVEKEAGSIYLAFSGNGKKLYTFSTIGNTLKTWRLE